MSNNVPIPSPKYSDGAAVRIKATDDHVHLYGHVVSREWIDRAWLYTVDVINSDRGEQRFRPWDLEEA